LYGRANESHRAYHTRSSKKQFEEAVRRSSSKKQLEEAVRRSSSKFFNHYTYVAVVSLHPSTNPFVSNSILFNLIYYWDTFAHLPIHSTQLPSHQFIPLNPTQCQHITQQKTSQSLPFLTANSSKSNSLPSFKSYTNPPSLLFPNKNNNCFQKTTKESYPSPMCFCWWRLQCLSLSWTRSETTTASPQSYYQGNRM
jgi:hypothetical protein